MKNKNEDSVNLNNFITDDEDIALFINKNNMNNGGNSINLFNGDNFRDEMNLKKDVEIKRINDYGNNAENIVINNTNDLDFFSNFSRNTNNNININIKNKKETGKNTKDVEDKDSQDNKYKKNRNNIFTKILRLGINILNLIFSIIIYFFKEILYKRSLQLKNYLHRKYGYTNAMRIMIALIIICFILIYSLLVILFAPKKKIQENNIEKINLIKNNTNDTVINNENKIIENNVGTNETNININENANKTKIDLINENNNTISNISEIDGNITNDKT